MGFTNEKKCQEVNGNWIIILDPIIHDFFYLKVLTFVIQF